MLFNFMFLSTAKQRSVRILSGSIVFMEISNFRSDYHTFIMTCTLFYKLLIDKA